MNETPEPGVYFDVPFTTYRAWNAVNNSLLSHVRRSPAHARAYLDGRLADEPSAALRLGSLVHAGILEPDDVWERYAVMPRFERDAENVTKDGRATSSKATSYYKTRVEQWEAEVGASNKQVVTDAEVETMQGVAAAVRANARAAAALAEPGDSEVTVVWFDAETGLLCKARLDRLAYRDAVHVITDIKTTRNAAEFPRAIATYGYHRQGAFYLRGVRAAMDGQFGFEVIAVETAAPYGCRCAPLAPEAIKAGDHEISELLRTFAECKASGVWPGYADPTEWELPRWCMPDDDPIELVVDGRTVTI